MEVELTLQDVEHLESKMEDLVGWMTANMSSFPAIAFAVTVLGKTPLKMLKHNLLTLLKLMKITLLTLLMSVNVLCVIVLRGKCNWPLKSLI